MRILSRSKETFSNQEENQIKALREPDARPKPQHPVHTLDPSLSEFNLQPEFNPFSPILRPLCAFQRARSAQPPEAA